MPGLPARSPLLSAVLWIALARTLRSQGLPRDADDAALALDDACGAGAGAPGACALIALQLRRGLPAGAGEAEGALGAARPGTRRRRTPAPDDMTAKEEAKLDREIARMRETIADASEELASLRDYENETRWLVTQHPPAGAAGAPPRDLATAPTRSLHVAAAVDKVEEALAGLRKLAAQCSRLDADTRNELDAETRDAGEAPVKAAAAEAKVPEGLEEHLAALQEELADLRSRIPALRTRAHETRRAYLKQVRRSGEKNATAEDSRASSEGGNGTADYSPASLEGFAHA